jgi:hypothetical protein
MIYCNFYVYDYTRKRFYRIIIYMINRLQIANKIIFNNVIINSKNLYLKMYALKQKIVLGLKFIFYKNFLQIVKILYFFIYYDLKIIENVLVRNS